MNHDPIPSKNDNKKTLIIVALVLGIPLLAGGCCCAWPVVTGVIQNGTDAFQTPARPSD